MHSCAIAGTTLSCWGNNAVGQIGDGTMAPSWSPIVLGGDWLSVAVGAGHTCAIALDHSLWCWGDNARGELGDGSTELVRPVPTRVGDQRGWQSLAVGDYDTCAIRSDGSLWCWGDNMYGQLGLGTALESTPVLVL